MDGMSLKAFVRAAAVMLPCYLVACGSPDSQQVERGLARVQVDPTRQWVSIDANDALVESVLLDLGKQAGFSLAIADGRGLGRVTIAVKNIEIEESIRRLLGHTPYTLRHAVGKTGRKTVAAVDVHRTTLDVAASHRPAGMMTAVGSQAGDSGWGADRGSEKGSADDADRVSHLVSVLEGLADETVKQLMSEAQDPALRVSMLEALMEREDQSSTRPLVLDALQDVDPEVRGAALEHLRSSYDPIPLAPLAAAVARETHPALRIDALALLSNQALTEGRTKEELMIALGSVSRALADPDPGVREQAQWSIEELAHAESLLGLP